MLQMTIYVNSSWQSHVKNVGVTCYTCHRGNNIPSYTWFKGVEPRHATGLISTHSGEALPYDPFTPFLLGHENIRVTGKTALPAGNRNSIQQTQWTYALMMHYATAPGVVPEPGAGRKTHAFFFAAPCTPASRAIRNL